MREIKYRGWFQGIDGREFWVYGYLLKQTNGNWEITNGETYWTVDDVGEYTGLKDKNGKEIYEGDIVVEDCYPWFDRGKPNYRGVVEWVFSQWQVIHHCVNQQKRGISHGVNESFNYNGVEEGGKSEWEVIGNIHENPELLEDKP